MRDKVIERTNKKGKLDNYEVLFNTKRMHVTKKYMSEKHMFKFVAKLRSSQTPYEVYRLGGYVRELLFSTK